ncbi:MarR family winged helix-turn-helix transcriptional regulator [Nocardia alni]|uniref:MarR family winged helix-turn-helix transcriptional regulator n=1 Tax=Nocardia alni TaxID=2815723 RepID=UPI001C22A2A4|nr:MarR family transcriptional regulator [Nocardia alni]
MEITDNILWLLKQAFHFTLRTLNESIAEHGITTAQLGLMRQLTDDPGLSGAELSRRLLITPQGIQSAVAVLERRGLVQRKPDPQHGRIIQSYLTDEGRRVTLAVFADAVAATEEVFGVLTPAEQRTLHDLLSRVVEQGTRNKLLGSD